MADVPLPQSRPGAHSAALPVRMGLADKARSLYVHVPFCAHKCHYCDFYSLVDTRDRSGAFVSRLERELRALGDASGRCALETIFVGGGTPTLLAPALWRGLLAILEESFDLSRVRAGVGEFTVECNPETSTPELFGVLREGGVNRLSMGAQSFHAAHLTTLERRHNPANVARTVELAERAGIERTSVDLIFAIPGQTLEEWSEDLALALGLGVGHVSCYALTYEPGTAMTARLARGEFVRADEDLEADMYEHAVATLGSHGFERYEVSNFTRPGQACRHSMAYWRQEGWLAAGPSASGHLHDAKGGSWRWKNTPRLDDYLQSDDHGFAPVSEVETPDPARLAAERVMTGVRLGEGVDLEHASRGLEPDARERLHAEAARQAGLGRVELRGARCLPTDRGFLAGDRVARELIASLHAPARAV